MARESIGATELLAMINEKMEWMNACRNLHVTCIGIDPKRTDGCNWQVAGIRRSGADHDQVDCDEAIGAFMKSLQARYDVKE